MPTPLSARSFRHAKMSRRLPPLLTLRAFEAAARHMSFTLAAAEMHLTQGAISRQVRSLEEFLGHKVFERHTRKIALTPMGEDYHRAVRQALDDIEQATERVRRNAERVIVTLNVLPTLGSLWLMGILSRFTIQHPSIDIRLVSSIHPVNFEMNDTDIALRVGRLPGQKYTARQPRIELVMASAWNNLCADKLFDDVLVPVASRSLLASGPIREPRDVLQHTLIHTASRRCAWNDWLGLHGLAVPETVQPMDFGHFFMGIRAAKDGKGVAILPSVVAKCLLDDNNLVAPLPGNVPSAGSYYLLTRESQRQDPAIRAVCDWLQEEAQALNARPLRLD